MSSVGVFLVGVTGEHFTAVLDLCSRRVVGWSAASSVTAELVTDALLMALWRRR